MVGTRAELLDYKELRPNKVVFDDSAKKSVTGILSEYYSQMDSQPRTTFYVFRFEFCKSIPQRNTMDYHRVQ